MAFHDKKPATRHVFKKNTFHCVNDVVNAPLSFDKSGVLNEKGLRELYSHLYIYRNKFSETFRYIIIDNSSKKIIDHLAVSSGSLNKSAVFLKNKDDSSQNNVFIQTLRDYIYENDYSLIVAHNHPSGNVEPSNQDIAITAKLELILSGLADKNKFLGHIILDHGEFSYYTPKTEWIDGKGNSWNHFNVDFENKSDNLLKKNIKPCFKFKINPGNVKQLALTAQELDAKENWNMENYTPIFAVNNNLVPVLVKFIENKKLYSIASDLKNKNLFGEFDNKNLFNDFNEDLIKTSKRFGCIGFIPIALNKKTSEALNIISRENLFIDVVIKEKETFKRISEIYPQTGYHFPIFTKDIIENREYFSKNIPLTFFEKSANFEKSKENNIITKNCLFAER